VVTSDGLEQARDPLQAQVSRVESPGGHTSENSDRQVWGLTGDPDDRFVDHGIHRTQSVPSLSLGISVW